MKYYGVLLDLEGVLYQEDIPIDGAQIALERLAQANVPVRFLTNTTTRPRKDIAWRLSAMGFVLLPEHVFSPSAAACQYLEAEGLQRVFVAGDPALAEDFDTFEITSENPDAVIMGDLYTRFDWHILNRIFSMLEGGARLIALHKNRYCRRDGEIALDLGPFVAAMEFAAGIDAVLMGKPNQTFFDMALSDMGLPVDAVVMVGDDPYADIGGAKAAGIAAVQVKTGKYCTSAKVASLTLPVADGVIGSIADLPAWLGL